MRHSCSGRSGSRVLRVSLLIVSRLRPDREIVGVVESERFGLVPGCAWGRGVETNVEDELESSLQWKWR